MKGFIKSTYTSLKKLLFKPQFSKNDGIKYWREQILLTFSLVGLYGGFIILIPSILASVRSNVMFIAFLDVIVYLYLVFIFTSNNISFRFRVNNILISMYVLSVVLLLVLGPYGAGLIWLFTVPLLAGILFGLKPAVRALIVNAVTLIIIGIVIYFNPFDGLLINAYVFNGYIAVALNFIALNCIFSLSLGVLLDGLHRTMEEKEKLHEILHEEKNTMKMLKEKAEVSDKIKTSFLTNISHDLRTPLNAVLGFTQLMSAKQHNQETIQKYCSIIMTQGESLLHLINDIIDIAKIEADEVIIKKEFFSLKLLLDEIAEFYTTQLNLTKQKEITIEVSIQEPLTDNIYQDQKRLRQILFNLVGNAVKFTTMGRIILAAKRYDNQSHLFFVKDTGMGIPEDKLKMVFERFRQLDESPTKKYQGVGLGLSICKSFVELLGGYIWVESEVGTGTTFYFKLPVS
jgi:signal transduction histidine kinase